jgi:hypothetical protein
MWGEKKKKKKRVSQKRTHSLTRSLLVSAEEGGEIGMENSEAI